jgi:hypothetical protein
MRKLVVITTFLMLAFAQLPTTATAAVAPSTSERSATAQAVKQMIRFGDARITNKRSAERHLRRAPKPLRTFVVDYLAKERRACGGARGSVGVVAYHREGFAAGDVLVDNCIGFGVIWKKGQAKRWKPIVWLQDSPQCADLRDYRVPRRLYNATGFTHCSNGKGVRVLY